MCNTFLEVSELVGYNNVRNTTLSCLTTETRRWSVRLYGYIIMAALILPSKALAFHTIFDFLVNRFEISGNLPGLIVDEFSGSTLSSNWVRERGTVSISGGNLHLKSPGEHIDYWGITFDRSSVVSTFIVQNGQGDFKLIIKN